MGAFQDYVRNCRNLPLAFGKRSRLNFVTEVDATISRSNSYLQYEPRVEGVDYDGMKTMPVDADKGRPDQSKFQLPQISLH